MRLLLLFIPLSFWISPFDEVQHLSYYQKFVPDSTKMVIETDKETIDFLTKTADIRLAGIKMGETAIDNGTVDEIRAYGELMVKDHTQLLQKIAEMAERRTLILPVRMRKSSERECGKLKEMKGQKFNRAYVKMMISTHKDDISNFEKAVKLKDKEVADFASKQIHSINLQLIRINQIKDRLRL